MAGFNYAQNIIGLKKGSGDIHELEVEVANLSASVLSIAGGVEDLSSKIISLDYEGTLLATDTGTVKEFTVNNLPVNYKIISVEPIYSSDYYTYIANKGVFGIGLANTSFIIRIASGNIGDSEQRKISFRIIAIKTN